MSAETRSKYSPDAMLDLNFRRTNVISFESHFVKMFVCLDLSILFLEPLDIQRRDSLGDVNSTCKYKAYKGRMNTSLCKSRKQLPVFNVGRSLGMANKLRGAQTCLSPSANSITNPSAPSFLPIVKMMITSMHKPLVEKTMVVQS
jgi:hypothetical protein